MFLSFFVEQDLSQLLCVHNADCSAQLIKKSSTDSIKKTILYI